MKTAAPRFHLDVLKQIAGAKVFARGEAYFRDGHVQLLAVEKGRIVAEVAGTEDYRTVVTGGGVSFDGECSCVAFEEWGVCKHMVAVALAANAPGAQAGGGIGVLDRIRCHLASKSPEALVEMIVEIAENDPDLFRRLELAAVAEGEADEAALEKRLRHAIDKATAVRDFIEYRAARAWAAGISDTLDAVAALDLASHAGLVVRLAEHATDRIAAASGSLDDSDGHCGGLIAQAQELHLAAAQVARPEPLAFAARLFSRAIDDTTDAFHDAPKVYRDVLGKAGLAEFRRLALAAWAELPPAKPDRADYGIAWRRTQLLSILDRFAEDDDDVEARIALRASNLSSPHEYYRLVQFCQEMKRHEDALRWAEEGLWMFEDGRPDERLLFLTIALLRGKGRHKDAVGHLWRAFGKAPSLEIYKLLRGIEGVAARDRAISELTARLASARKDTWFFPADLLIRVHVEERDFDAAWALARKHSISSHLGMELAKTTENSHPRNVIEVYAARVEQLAGHGGNPAYAEAKQLIDQIRRLQSRDDHRGYVAGVKERHARKRNFMKLLE